MKLHPFWVISSVAVFIVGCESLSFNPTVQWPWAKTQPCTPTKLVKNASGEIGEAYRCNLNDAMQAFLTASKFCRDVQNYYESGGKHSSEYKFWVGTVGTLAGAVVSPIAQGTAKSAWSGLAGATNGIQTSMEQSFSSALNANRMIAVNKSYASGASEIVDSSGTVLHNASDSSYEQSVFRSIKMAADCAMSPGLADAKVLNNIASGTTGK
ncbi:hypothetical protein [Chromobacterium haemolyticum]|uniref:hypothetical protein n=1 Tax=Chromobacterium haemolyticum TaxID=394935 RepID=UPI0013181F75|nr:hypothetical protein [Chromobacterium haemolyticum]BBH12922.1 hypothetical protein CH06BL_21700 [Chromobacterium haemolyticum]